MPLVLAVLLFAFSCVAVSGQEAPRSPELIVQSHRGAGVLAAENTIAAFKLGWKLSTIPEADVRTTSDGVIVAFHDGDFSRVVHDASPELKKKGVKDVTFAELSQLEVGAESPQGFQRRHVSSMDDIFAIMRGRPERRLYLDIKQVDLAQLAELVRRREVAPQVILASTDLKIIRRWKELLPSSQTLHWMGGTEESLRVRIEALRQSDFAGVTQLQIHIKQVKGAERPVIQPSEAFVREVARELKPRGIVFQALPWGASDPAVYRQLLALGVESFATDYPDVVMPVMREHFAKESTRDVTLKVGSEPRQKLLGFGCSLVDLGKAKIPEKERAEMFDRVIRDLGMNVVRLWIPSGADRTVEQMKAEFYSRYVDSGAVTDVQQRGVTTLLLAPARGEKPPSEPMTEYARKLAIFIDGVRKERGVKLSVTGIANEPAGFSPEQLSEAVRVLRAELDARGLADVGIVAPEWASADGTALKAIAGLQADPAAWAALRGIATHSYNMAATPKFPTTIAGTNKEYWQTEAGDTGNEGPADANRAASLSARFLNDLNHGVTHWIQFIGLSESQDVTTDRDNATKFMVYDHKSARIFSHLKYDWFRQLRATFPTGSEVHSVQAVPGGDLLFSYGQKPLLNAAAVRLPDGRWSLGAVNLSGVTPDTKIAKWNPAAELAVTWDVPSLAAAGDVTLEIFRSTETERFSPAGQAVMRSGKLTLPLAPRELVTLTTAAPMPR